MIYERFLGVIARVGRVFYDSADVDFHASAPYTLATHTRENIKYIIKM